MKYLSVFILLFISLEFFGQFKFDIHRSIVVERMHDLNISTGVGSSGNPLHVDLSFNVMDKITAGPEISWSYFNREGFKGTSLNFGLRGQYELNEFYYLGNHIDIYSGVSLGYDLWLHDFKYKNFPRVNAKRITAFVGYKHFIAANNVAFHVELHAGTYFGLHFGTTYRIF